jgi:hypothetical protein
MFASMQTLYNDDPAVTDGTITVSAAPTGTKLVGGIFCVIANAAGQDACIRGRGAFAIGDFGWIRSQGTVAIAGSFLVPLDSNKQFDWSISNAANISYLSIKGHWYWI